MRGYMLLSVRNAGILHFLLLYLLVHGALLLRLHLVVGAAGIGGLMLFTYKGECKL